MFEEGNNEQRLRDRDRQREITSNNNDHAHKPIIFVIVEMTTETMTRMETKPIPPGSCTRGTGYVQRAAIPLAPDVSRCTRGVDCHQTR